MINYMGTHIDQACKIKPAVARPQRVSRPMSQTKVLLIQHLGIVFVASAVM